MIVGSKGLSPLAGSGAEPRLSSNKFISICIIAHCALHIAHYKTHAPSLHCSPCLHLADPQSHPSSLSQMIFPFSQAYCSGLSKTVSWPHLHLPFSQVLPQMHCVPSHSQPLPMFLVPEAQIQRLLSHTQLAMSIWAYLGDGLPSHRQLPSDSMHIVPWEHSCGPHSHKSNPPCPMHFISPSTQR